MTNTEVALANALQPWTAEHLAGPVALLLLWDDRPDRRTRRSGLCEARRLRYDSVEKALAAADRWAVREPSARIRLFPIRTYPGTRRSQDLLGFGCTVRDPRKAGV